MANPNYLGTGPNTETEEPGILVHLVTRRMTAFSGDPAAQEEAEQNWIERLGRERKREGFLRALRERRRPGRPVNHRLRTAVLTRRLMAANPRDERE